ncbi:MAG: hypothetical protein ACTSUJ_05955 [Candidatus Njordarchaeales archaeon]
MLPIAVSIIDRSGLPIVTIPSGKRMDILSGVISAILEITRDVSGEVIEFVKVKNGIIFLQNIGERGYLLLFFQDVKDPEEVKWIIILFVNELEKHLEGAYEFVDDTISLAIKMIYEELAEGINEIYEIFQKVRKYYYLLRKIIGKEADLLITKCSDNLFKIVKERLYMDYLKIKDRGLSIRDIRRVVVACEKVFYENIKKFA